MGIVLSTIAGWMLASRMKASETVAAVTAPAKEKYSSEALRQNTLGVAYMNQGKAPEAQKFFEKALELEPNFAAGAAESGNFLSGTTKIGVRAERRWRKHRRNCRTTRMAGTTWDWHLKIWAIRKKGLRRFNM